MVNDAKEITSMMRVFDEEGIELDVEALSGLDVKCFKCEKKLKEKGAILFSSPSKTYSDNVDVVSKYHLCKGCFTATLEMIMGKTADIYLPNELALLQLELENGNYRAMKDRIKEMQEKIKTHRLQTQVTRGSLEK